ncbi:hypothetical protein V8C40DRAFT_244451 [Trichoderma camerunense]
MTLMTHSRHINAYKQQVKNMFRTSRTENYEVDSSKGKLPNRRRKTNLVTAEISSTHALAPVSLGFEGSDQLEKLQPSLWDRAYDGLKKTDKQLVEEYEKLLSRELQTNTDEPVDHHDNSNEYFTAIKNQIDSTNPKARLEQLKSITSSGLQQLKDGRTTYLIFGREFIPREQLAQTTRFIQNIRNVIDEAVKVSPYASLAWAGISVILPIFTNPSVSEEASREGCLYVTSRIQFYVKLEPLLLSSDRMQASSLSAELEDRLVTLYQQIISFQMKIVRRVYLTRLARFKEDTVRHEDWEGMMVKIQEAERILSNDFKQANDAVIGRELEKLSSNAEKVFTDITSVLVPLMRDSHKASTIIFRNTGSGYQFNATTGGVQNNAIGNGTHFIGTTFSGSVSFGHVRM